MRFIKTLKNLFGLPAGYTRLEYLASNGNQYIDTEYKLVSGTTHTFNGNIMWTQSNGNANFFYGYRSVDSAEYRGDMRAFFVYGTSAPPAGRLAIRYGVNTDNSSSTISFYQRYNISFDGTNLKVDGTTFINLSEAYTPANYQNMWLFNCNCTGYYSADVSGFIGRIYSFKIFEDGVTVRDFIPCLDPFGNPCMYDLVNRKAHYNKGTGEFTYGRQIIPVEYLESTGTQYIDTGYKPSINTVTEMLLDNYTFSGIESFFGVYLTDYRTNCYHCGCYESDLRAFVNGSPALTSYYGNIVNGVTFPSSISSIKLSNTALTVNGTDYTYTQNPNTPLNVTSNMILFGYSNAGTFRDDRGLNGKVKSTKIWDNGVLVRDYIPAKDENGIGFLFDKVTSGAYLNSGTGSFGIGDNVYQPSLRFVVDNNRVVPAGFKEIEYLESTGTQYIDTGIIPTNTHGISINFSFSSNESFDASWCPIGARTEDIRFWINKSVDDSGLTFGFGDYKTSRQTQPKNTLLKASLNLYNNRKMIYVNGNYQENITSSISNLSNTLYLFGANVNGSISFIPPDCRIYKVQISEGSVLVRDFIPCLDGNNVPCMYDLVEGKPYYNQGTGTFTVGRQVIPVEYIESTGTQWINTGVFPTNEMEFESKFTFTSLVSTNLTVIGSRDSTKRCQPIGTYNNKWSASIGGSYDANGSSVSANTSYVVKSIVANGQTITLIVNGNQASVCTNTTGLPNQELYIFGRNFYGNTDPVDSRINAKIYFMKIKAGNVLVRDFIPCKDENNVGYMFDRVNHVIHENNGTGSFITGDTKKEIIFRLPKDPIPREYQIVSYLESSGTQYIDTLWHPSSNDLRVNFKVQSMGSPSATAICGAEKRDVVPRWVFIMYGQSDDTNKTFPLIGNWNNVNPSTAFTFKNGTVLDIDWTANSTSTTITDKVSNTTYNYTFSPNITYSNNDVTLKLFCNATSQKSSIRMYKYKIWDNNILVRNFVPVIRKSDSVAGMYDIVTKQFFENAGTGTFNYG